MVQLMRGDCLERMRELPENSVDSLVTDSPYGLSFMGKKWDYDVPSVEIWREALRVLKPGGHLLSFGGTRTYHRMVVNIEDAGFEIRDQIMWIYGSGFPKSHDVGKGIDKQAGALRERIKTNSQSKPIHGGNFKPNEAISNEAISNEAKQWQGWGTALKPANEPICVARKPLEKGLTIAQNVLKWGTGAINVDESRIEYTSEADKASAIPQGKITTKDGKTGVGAVVGGVNNYEINREDWRAQMKGRWPANILFDEEAAAMLPTENKQSVSRFFYVAKASRRERNAGLEGMPERVVGVWGGEEDDLSEGRKSTIPRQNFHPTVKPVKLMQYLITLVTPPNGIVLDPFMGSGTTGVAAKNLKFSFIGIERDQQYMKIAEKRIEAANDKP